MANHDITVIVVFALCILGPSLIIASAGFASISALGRNPSAAPKIFTAMIMMLIFGAAISIVGLLVIFQIYAPKG
jgi:F0F1-type ATP synthase membrane subunit c/vacuolar-type H+-ATPase subunit K